MLHIGKKIREVLTEQQMPVSVFAKKINRSRNVVYDIFERNSLDTELLQKISTVLQYNFFSFYIEKTYYNSPTKTNKVKELKEIHFMQKENELKNLHGKLEHFQKENKLLQEYVESQKKIIRFLEKSKK